MGPKTAPRRPSTAQAVESQCGQKHAHEVSVEDEELGDVARVAGWTLKLVSSRGCCATSRGKYHGSTGDAADPRF